MGIGDWGLGWGCGGNMTPEFYAGEYKKYASFCKNYSGNNLYRIACGPSAGDYEWTETMMTAFNDQNKWLMDGLSLHFYSIPDWNNKGFAVEFDDEGYYTLLETANFVDTLLKRHSEIMNRYDPEGRVGLIVDEWGTWFDVEPGTNPGFLYQQNTMRDAMVAALTLNYFNRYCKRVKMANIAQVVNVLQAIILTEGEKLIKTPTYHVFDLFKEHQNGEAVYCWSENEKIGSKHGVPMVSSSASVKDGVLTLTLANVSLDEEAEISCDVCNFAASEVSARILTGDAHAHNDFDAPDTVTVKAHSAELKDGKLTVKLPACSAVEVTLR